MRNHITLGLLVVAGVANASVIIDDFTSGTYHQTITSGSVTEFQAGTMLGGSRYATTQVDTNVFGLELGTDIELGNYTLSAQSGVNGQGQLGYGYQDNAGTAVQQDMNADLSTENQFKLDFISSDLPGTYTIGVRSSSSNGGNFATYTGAFQGSSVNAPFTETVNFSEFSGFNFGDVDQITFNFNSDISGDVSLSGLQAVPEPTSMVILATASAMALRRRKKS